MKIITYCLILYTCLNHAYAQSRVISGTVYSRNGKPIPYVNIGIKGSNNGTVSNQTGQFKIELPDTLLKEVITFSCVGYIQKDLPIKLTFAKEQNEIFLEQKIIELAEVKINNKGRKSYKIGIIARTPFIMTPSESYNDNDIIEQARLIPIKQAVKLLDANIYLASSVLDSVKLRLNFYKLVNGIPGERVVEKNIVQTFALKKGWLSFDLSKQDIFMNEDFVVSFEYLPDEQIKGKKIRLFFGAKLGSSNSYGRNSSLGLWQKHKGVNTTIYVTVRP